VDSLIVSAVDSTTAEAFDFVLLILSELLVRTKNRSARPQLGERKRFFTAVQQKWLRGSNSGSQPKCCTAQNAKSALFRFAILSSAG
jgi:hypothetical protein